MTLFSRFVSFNKASSAKVSIEEFHGNFEFSQNLISTS